MNSSTTIRLFFLVLGIATLALQVLSFGSLRGQLWGVHFYSFLPLAMGLFSWALLLAALGWFCWPGSQRGLPAALHRGLEFAASRPRNSIPVAMIACGGLFWFLRSQQTLLGDSWTIMTHLDSSDFVHLREPLTQLLLNALHSILSPAMADLSATAAVQRTVAISSVVAGMAFAPVAFILGRLLTSDRSEALLVAAVICSQGYAQLFFGYVEYYSFYALGVGCFLLVGILYLRGRVPLIVPALVFTVTVGLHVSALILSPALLALIVFGFFRNSRIATFRDLVVGALAIFAMDRVLHIFDDKYSVMASLHALLAASDVESAGSSGLTYMFSLLHLRDFLNEQALLGPLAAALFLPVLIVAIRRGAWRRMEFVFLAIAAAVSFAAQWVMTEPSLGYARDWDLFAPVAISMTVAGLAGLVYWVEDAGVRRTVLLVGWLLSLGHLLPWVWNNASEDRALARMEILPLGLGRAEFLVGNWHWRHDNDEEAERWFRRAIDAHPVNHSAHFNLASLLQERGQLNEAVASYERALRIRPHQDEFLMGLTRALIAAGRNEDALPHLEKLRRRHPENFQYALYHGQVLRSLGRQPEARAAFRAGADVLGEALREYQALLDAGVLMTQLGEHERAVGYYARAFVANARSAQAAYYLSASLWQLGRRPEARPYMEAALELDLSREQRQQLNRWLRQLESGE